MSAPRYTIKEVEVGQRDVALTLPFRFGDTQVTGTAEAYLRVVVEGSRGLCSGVAAQLMVPRWFDKRPARTNAETVDDLRASVLQTAGIAPGLAGTARGLGFELRETVGHILGPDMPRLAIGFGPALLEMALADAVCRDLDLSFPAATRADAFGVAESAPRDISADAIETALRRVQPNRRLLIRHTVGFDAPLYPDEVGEPPPDGRPVALSSCIERQGLQAFKIKLKGVVDADADWLCRVARILDPIKDLKVSIDANEQYAIADFRELLARLRGTGSLGRFRRSILYFEQPFARQEALSPEVTHDYGVPIIIDESDDTDDAILRATACGWDGVSVKSCKGIFRAMLNYARVSTAQGEGRSLILSAEDLTCQPGLCWQQDTLMAATLGVSHAERNGHHFAGGFQGASNAERAAYLERHPGLYQGPVTGPALRIEAGAVRIDSLFAPCFGSAPGPEFNDMMPITQ